MNDDMPWVDLTPEEIQELRSKKQQLTEYGKQKIRELMTHEEMLEEAAKREAINKEALESMGIDYENFGQKPWNESMLEETQLTEKENKVLDIAKNIMEENKEAMEQLAEIERQEFYRFFAVEYFGTGEGISYWLKICRNYGCYDGRDLEMERFKEFIGCDHYYPGIEELIEQEFMGKFANLIPRHIVKMVDRKDQPALDWETHFHVNYS